MLTSVYVSISTIFGCDNLQLCSYNVSFLYIIPDCLIFKLKSSSLVRLVFSWKGSGNTTV